MMMLTPALAGTAGGDRAATNPLLAALLGGTASGLIAAATGLLLGMNLPALYVLAFFLIGVGPVLGQQLAAGKLGQDWKSLLGGVVGFILPIVSSLILWPLLVWLFNRSFGFGMLWLGSLLGLILGIAGFFAVGLTMGQDPAWVGLGWAVLWSLWGGSVAAFMAAGARS